MSITDIYQAVVKYQIKGVVSLVEEELEKGTPWQKVLEYGLIAPLSEIGKEFSAGTIFIPEMLAAAKTVKQGLTVIRPIMTSTGAKHRGTIVIGTVKGDMHDIGKNLVAMMLEGAGFNVLDLGVDVPMEKFLEAVNQNQAKVLGLSALLTTTLPNMEQTVRFMKEKAPGIKILVGGAPVDEVFAEKIGADVYARDAAQASEKARMLDAILTGEVA